MTHPKIIDRIWLAAAERLIRQYGPVPVPVPVAARMLLNRRPDLVEAQVERDQLDQIAREILAESDRGIYDGP